MAALSVVDVELREDPRSVAGGAPPTWNGSRDFHTKHSEEPHHNRSDSEAAPAGVGLQHCTSSDPKAMLLEVQSRLALIELQLAQNNSGEVMSAENDPELAAMRELAPFSPEDLPNLLH